MKKTRGSHPERSQLFGCPQSAVTRRTEAMLNLNELRVELLQSEARDLLFVCFQQETADASLRSA
jgi:hypothetical protein